jgi:anti-sigma B factor antagonist
MAGMNTGEQQGAADDLLHLRAERDRDCVVIHVDGEIDYGTASQLRDEAATVVQGARNPRLVLDLGGVTFCDSSGLGVLVGIWKAVHALGGQLVLARVPRRCRQLLKGTGLANILQVRDGLAEAVAAVSG